MKWNMERWRRGQAPAWWYGNEDAGAIPSMTAWTLDNHRNYVRLRWPPSGTANILGVMWNKGPSEGFAVTPQTMIDVRNWAHIRDSLITDHPTTPGIHYYRLQLFSVNSVSFIQPDTHSATIT